MLSQLILIFGALSTVYCHCGPCNAAPPKHYEELGCAGQQIDSSCCPDRRFECPDLAKLDTNVCHLKGKTYKIGDKVADADSPLCHEGCICYEGSDGIARFSCPISECADWFLPPKPDCVKQYSLNQCCSVNRICGDEVKNVHKCDYRGKTYSHGEKFRPKSNYLACHDCICDENFDNSTDIEENKNCKKIDCGMELRDFDKFKRGCVPIYFNDSKCCPILFKCPDERDKVLPYEGLPDINSVNENTLCKFGTLTLQRYQNIETNDKNLECTCRQPPMIECIVSRNT